MKKKQKKQMGFGESLDQYILKRVGSVPWRWEWVGTGVAGVVIVVSVATGYINSPTLGTNKIEIIQVAGERGDYKTAQALYEEVVVTTSQAMHVGGQVSVLGVNTELEELVYPERKLAREIKKQEDLLVKYPGSRDILLTLANLYEQAENHEKSGGYLEKARVLDPNYVGR